MISTNFKSYLLLIILSVAIFLPGLFNLPIVDRDAPYYAQATRQMLETGNYWQIKFQDKARHLKPPGIYWLQALAVKTFSSAKATTVWPYRVPGVLGGLLAILFTFYFARKFYPEKIALCAAALLGSSLLLSIESHLVLTDAMLLFTMVLMQGALWQIYVNKRIRWGWILLFWLAMAAGVLIKGITPLVGFLTLIALAIWDKNLEIFRKTKIFWGLGILIVCSLWLIPLSLAGKSNFLWDMIHTDVLPKLIGGQESHGMPPGYFLVIFPLMFFPGALFVWHGAKSAWQNHKQSVERFLLAWIIPSWIFFELVHTKLPQYVLPTYPAIAILIAASISNRPSYNKLVYLIWALFGLLFIAVLVYVPYFLTGNFSILSIVAAIIIAIVILTARLNIYIPIIGMILAFALVWQWVLPGLKPLWISDKIVSTAEKYAVISQEKLLLSIGYKEPSLVFLTGTNKVEFVNADEALRKIKPGGLAIVDYRFKKKFSSLKALAIISGFNYNAGHKISLTLYQR
jgi:4-amino-4-deoxy-L-arabinose transferase-like glycosyltransferase